MPRLHPGAARGSTPKRLLTASSIETTVGDLIDDVPGASDIAPTGEEVKAAYDVAPADIQRVHGRRRTAPRSTSSSAPGRARSRSARRGRRRDPRPTDPPPEGISATPSGLAVVGVGLLDNLEANRILLTYLAILFVFLFLAVRLRSIIRSLLSLVPVLIAVGAASLVAYAFDLKLSPMTAVGGPLVVAACTEFTSLILLRFVEERRRGLEPKEAVDVAGVAHRSGLHRVRPDRHRRRRRAVVLVAAAAARLRIDRRHERRGRAAQRLWSSCRRCWCGPTSATGSREGSSISPEEPFVETPPIVRPEPA